MIYHFTSTTGNVFLTIIFCNIDITLVITLIHEKVVQKTGWVFIDLDCGVPDIH